MQTQREKSILSSIINRNKGDGARPLDRTFNKYKIDKSKLDDSVRVREFEENVADNISKRLHANAVDNITNNTSNIVNNNFEDNELTKFYADELRDVVSDVSGMSRTMLKNQLDRMDALLHTLADTDLDEKDFLLDQYAKSITFLEDEYKRKSNVMMRTQTFMGNLASEYLDVQSLYAGFVDHNPLAMGLFKMGKNALDNHRESKLERQQLIENDIHRQVMAEHTEKRKAQLIKDEEERAKELDEANRKAGVVVDDNKPSNQIKQSISNESNNQVDDSKNDVESRVRDDNLKKRQYKLLKTSAKETSKWQKKVLKRLRKIERVGGVGGKRGKHGMVAPAGILSSIGGIGKSVLGGLVGGLGASVVGAGGMATAGTVGVGALIGTAIGTGITKGYEALRGGKGTIGTDVYDLINDNYMVKSIEDRGIVDRDWIGNSELDTSRLGELGADELKALLELKDFDKEDTRAIMKELKKKTDARLSRIKKSRIIQRQREQERIISMTPNQRIREYGYDPIARDNDNSSYLQNRLNNKNTPLQVDYNKPLSGTINVDEVLRNANRRGNFVNNVSTLKVGEVGGASTPEIKALLEQISQGEGTGGASGYDKLFGARKDGYNRFDIKGRKKLTDMTLDEVRAYQDTFLKNQLSITGKREGSTAVGKGQFIRKTFDSIRGEMGLSGDTKFTPDVQDAMMEHLIRKNGGLNKFLKSDKTGADKVKFMSSLSSQYSSVANPTSGVSAHTFNGQRQPSVNNIRNMNNVMDSLANPSKPRAVVDDFAVENQGIEKVKTIQSKADFIEEKQAKKEDAPVVVSQTVATTNNSAGGGMSDIPAVRSARNSDSGVQRISDRQISNGYI